MILIRKLKRWSNGGRRKTVAEAEHAFTASRPCAAGERDVELHIADHVVVMRAAEAKDLVRELEHHIEISDCEANAPVEML